MPLPTRASTVIAALARPRSDVGKSSALYTPSAGTAAAPTIAPTVDATPHRPAAREEEPDGAHRAAEERDRADDATAPHVGEAAAGDDADAARRVRAAA